jgi:AcrR family transcriptional regulator
MKTIAEIPVSRPYRQKARAAAAEASSRRIVAAFMKRAETGWFEEITLDSVARDAGVTVQTVLRKFPGKEALLEAACRRMGEAVRSRRAMETSGIDEAIEALARDYEASGRVIIHLLNQEGRHPALKTVLNFGRRGHRDWLAGVFARELDRLGSARRAAALDALVVATDVYVWKLVRIDMGRPVAAFKAIVRRLIRAALATR